MDFLRHHMHFSNPVHKITHLGRIADNDELQCHSATIM